MASTKKSSQPRRSGGSPRDTIVHRDLAFDLDSQQEAAFKRADLVFEGVDHAQDSYEVRVFLNNREADETTARSPENGYAGRFVVFGHGQCFGSAGHCDPASAASEERDGLDSVRRHPSAPRTRVLTITEPLLRVLSSSDRRLTSLTLVPVSKAPRRDQRGLAASLFTYKDVSLRTYR